MVTLNPADFFNVEKYPQIILGKKYEVKGDEGMYKVAS